MQLQQWLAQHSGLKDHALADVVAEQPWDPSVQAMAALPDVVKQPAVAEAAAVVGAEAAAQGDSGSERVNAQRSTRRDRRARSDRPA